MIGLAVATAHIESALAYVAYAGGATYAHARATPTASPARPQPGPTSSMARAIAEGNASYAMLSPRMFPKGVLTHVGPP